MAKRELVGIIGRGGSIDAEWEPAINKSHRMLFPWPEFHLDSLLRDLSRLRHKKTRFFLATAFVLAALAITAMATFLFGSTAGLIFALAVGASTALFGLVAGLCTAAAAVLAVDFFYIPPSFAFNMDSSTLRIALALTAISVFTHLIERQTQGTIRSKTKALLGARVYGELDGIENGDAYGWAFNADEPASPVLVTLSVDDRPVAQVAAVHYRADVENIMNCSGKHGFFVDIGEQASEEKEALVDVRLLDGSSLKNSPRKLRVQPRVPSQAPTVLFMHIPKTAGTAFREAIAANYRRSEIAYLYPTPPGFLVTDVRALPLEQRRSFRVVIGHFQYGMHAAIPRRYCYVTIVREPSRRILSHYAFLREAEPAGLAEGQRTLNLVEFLEQKSNVNFDNALVRFFAGVPEHRFPFGSLDREIYERAVHHLRTAFTFVGHQENSANAYGWLQNRFGWHAKPALDHINATLVSASAPDRSEVRKAIEHFNRWDLMFYQEILRLFPYDYSG
jgi:Domain of unknown function (DUF4118)/Sulfotransferase family